MRLAIIGAGPAGLVTLKYALDELAGWSVECFEKQSGPYGSWGKTHPDFLSTSTKFATQFSCHRTFDLSDLDAPFFRADEYGDYLDDFTDHYGLRAHIHFQHTVREVSKSGDQWNLSVDSPQGSINLAFDALVVCSGLANKLRPLDISTPSLQSFSEIGNVTGKTIVVFGGGESAVDIADRLARPEAGNTVYLSLRSGIRVSPRIHPIRGVPSDFLRSRLMLSAHENVRNAVGQWFVEFRIKSERLLRRLFPGRAARDVVPSGVQDRKAWWGRRINDRAEGKLFNMFHNKSDDFVTSIAEGRIQVIGPAKENGRQFWNFDQDESLDLTPDLVANAVGYDSGLEELTSGLCSVRDLYAGCLSCTDSSLFAVGYARPIIGNIPSIAELQARYVVATISGRIERPKEIETRQAREHEARRRQYPSIDVDRVYPVDAIPYSDRLARLLGIYPTRSTFSSLRDRIHFWLSPATTSQYEHPSGSEPIFVPPLAVVLMLLIKLFDIPYTLLMKSRERS